VKRKRDKDRFRLRLRLRNGKGVKRERDELNEPNKLNKLFTLNAIFTSAFRILTSALLCRYHESRTGFLVFTLYELRFTLDENI